MKEIYVRFLKKAFVLMLFFSLQTLAQDFSKVDAIVSNYPKSFSKVEDLASKINHDFSKEEEKARAIYSWIAFNVKYDVKSYFSNSGRVVKYSYRTPEEKIQKQNQIKLDKVNNVLKTKLAVCQGYALLFEHLANLSGLENAIVTGNAKTNPSDIGKLPTESSHAWNAIKVNGKWKLVDVTWGAGVVNEQKRTFIPKFNAGYFFTEPEVFVLNHFPDDKQWVLGKFSQKDYANFPFYYAEYLRSDFRFITPEKGIISSNKATILKFKIEDLAETDKVFYVLSSDDKARNAVLKKAGNISEFEVNIAQNSNYYLTVFVNQKAISMYKITRGKSTAI
ncbi:transglutaminase domain-containing protein [Flavobacterium qiangtangense]|uniref:Transglutaminase domain-containing protein n=1 Tax=Flavobacterium qiangtangense TaxID=1442595 RepID=A0ABW1PJM4_9FLAO